MPGPRIFTPEETRYILHTMEHGTMSVRDLRERMRCDDRTLYKLAEKHGINRLNADGSRGRQVRRRLFKDEEIAWLIPAFAPENEDKPSIQSVQLALNCHYGTVLRLFKRLGIEVPKVARGPRPHRKQQSDKKPQSSNEGKKRPCLKCRKIFFSPDPKRIQRCNDCKALSDSYVGCNAHYVGVIYGR